MNQTPFHLLFAAGLLLLGGCPPEAAQFEEPNPSAGKQNDAGVSLESEPDSPVTDSGGFDAGAPEIQLGIWDSGEFHEGDGGHGETLPEDAGEPSLWDAGTQLDFVSCLQSTECVDNDDCCTPGCTNDEDNDCDNQTVISIQPYLQFPTPTSMWIMWETEDAASSMVLWGTTVDLVNGTDSTSFTPWLSGRRVHETHLENLEPDTLYFYQVHTGNTTSAIYHFITPDTADSEAPTQLVAMSDMQKDNSNPDKFREIVEEGVLDYLAAEWPDYDLTEILDLVLIPGDLVDSGLFYSQFRTQFFNPAEGLLSYVPVLPVLGNHEANSQYYFDLFHLPEQASGNNKEHWWYSDHSNLRVIGLDSNWRPWPYDADDQLAWLEETLNEACDADNIDFVFTELHHPAKSEAWPVGESDFTMDVVERMENFTATCDKPSIHFFGHTHAYSRGQSRDHRHLWVNVASAGGNLDYWDEYNQTDYDEFNVTLDEYGFVLVDVQAGTDPSFLLQRISRGDENNSINNAIKDEVFIRRYNQSPVSPTGLSPSGNDLCPWDLILAASEFSDPDTEDEHGASHWQISDDCDDFASPLWESWKQHENWYRDEDLQAEDDLTDEAVASLDSGGSYCWRVRYRDRGLTWSPWSTPMAFSTVNGTGNLLDNPGAEAGMAGWTTTAGHAESLLNAQCNGIAPHSGFRYFAIGALCDSASYSEAMQEVHVPGDLYSAVDNGSATASFGGYLANYSGDDQPEMKLVFTNGNNAVLGQSEVLGTLADEWTWLTATVAVPTGTRHVEMVLMGTRNAGSDNDSYFDDLFLELGACQ